MEGTTKLMLLTALATSIVYLILFWGEGRLYHWWRRCPLNIWNVQLQRRRVYRQRANGRRNERHAMEVAQL